MKKERARVRYSNRCKVLLCYLAAFALPPLTLWAALRWAYPYKLRGAAPQVMENLLALGLGRERVVEAASLSSVSQTASPELWREALLQRERQWMLFLCAVFAVAWLLTLILQLLWRARHSRAWNAAKHTRQAIRDYRLTQGIVWAVNALAAGLVWLLGVQFIQGRTVWDYLTYFLPYALNGLAALCCFRLAAPPSLSGRNGFFKRW